MSETAEKNVARGVREGYAKRPALEEDAWARIQQRIPSLGLVPRLVPNPPTGSSDVNVAAAEWRVLTMVNGANSIEQIAQRSGLGEFRTCEIIVQMLQSGLVELREPTPDGG